MATVKGDVHDIGKNIVGVVLQCNNYDVIDLGVMVPTQKILDTAKEVGADIIGLSGLITPSLDEMVRVAGEMERQGFEIPLLLGGATTSRAHTAVKVDGQYHGPVVWVKDASRSVPVVSQLLSDEQRGPFLDGVAKDYDAIRVRHAAKTGERPLASYEQAVRQPARARLGRPTARCGPTCSRSRAATAGPARPTRTGTGPRPSSPGSGRTSRSAELRRYIDWTPFFQAWEIKGRYPDVLNNAATSEQARSAVRRRAADARPDRGRALAAPPAVSSASSRRTASATTSRSTPTRRARRCSPRCTGCASRGSTATASRTSASPTSWRPRRPASPTTSGPSRSPPGSASRSASLAFKADHDDYSAILLESLADRLAEAFAERLHEKVRRELWGYAPDEHLEMDELIREKYHGIRPAPGYPACPEHTEKETL